MKNSSIIFSELYKRKEYKKIPIGMYPNGELFYMTDKQIKAMELMNDDSTTIVGYGGSARSGKTILECSVIILDCISYPDIAWGLGRRELTTLKRTTLITLFNQIMFFGIEPKDYIYNQQLNKITFHNKSEIYLIDTAFRPSDPLNTRFGGLELTRCAIDESNETHVSIINKLFERTGWRHNDRYGLKRKQFECFNPSKDHVYTRFYYPYKTGNEGINIKFIPALPSDNPNPAVKEWINDLIKVADKVTINRQIHGNFDYDDDPTSLISYEFISNIWTNNHVDRNGIIYLVADIARFGSDKAIITIWNGFVIIDYFLFDKSSTVTIQNCINASRSKYKIAASRCIADEDGIGGGVVDNCGILGFENNSKSSDDAYFNLKSQCGYLLAELIHKIYFEADVSDSDKSCIEEELAQLKTFDSDKDGRLRILPKAKIRENIARSPDWLDNFIMRMYFEVFNTNASDVIYNKALKLL